MHHTKAPNHTLATTIHDIPLACFAAPRARKANESWLPLPLSQVHFIAGLNITQMRLYDCYRTHWVKVQSCCQLNSSNQNEGLIRAANHGILRKANPVLERMLRGSSCPDCRLINRAPP